LWAVVIPKNARAKDISWNFVRHISSKQSALTMALNGNTPTRLSTYLDEKFREKVSYAEIEYHASKEARVVLPGFDAVAEANLLINEYIERAMLGEKEPQAAMDELSRELRALSKELRLPQEAK